MKMADKKQTTSLFQLKEKSHQLYRPDIKRVSEAHGKLLHQCVFAVAMKPGSMDELVNVLYDVSDPNSKNYGKYWSRQQIGDFTRNYEAYNRIHAFLEENNITIDKETLQGEYIFATASIEKWSSLLNTKFYDYEISNEFNGKKLLLVRSEEYSLPSELKDFIIGIFNTVQFPDAYVPASYIVPDEYSKHDLSVPLLDPNHVTPALINNFYNVTTNKGSKLATQGVYESLGQVYSPLDLSNFQENFGLPQQKVAYDIGGHEDDKACFKSVDDCLEANLDIQYLMAIAQDVPTTYYYDDNWVLTWITDVTSGPKPLDVYSISYGGYELGYSDTEKETFQNEAIKLGVGGSTILASSGDDGVSNFLARNAPENCGYFPSFPATSPYVTAVGATQGPEEGTAEIACMTGKGVNNNTIITTGGGFSTLYELPSFQRTFVDKYFASVSGTSKEPYTNSSYSSISVYYYNYVNGPTLVTIPGPFQQYDPNGRGYPDISLLGHSYDVFVNGSTTPLHVDGTSASSPVMAGFVSLANSKRIENNLPKLGWLNPLLYSNYNKFTRDITIGDNKCTAAVAKNAYGGYVGTCCKEGFYVEKGWDPVTGLGSVDFGLFLDTTYNIAVQNAGSGGKSNSNKNIRTVAGTAVAVSVVLVLLICGVMYFFYWRGEKNKKSQQLNESLLGHENTPDQISTMVEKI